MESIARSLERDSVLVRRALLGLGSAGAVLVVALAWAIRRMITTSTTNRRRDATRRGAAVVVGSVGRLVPREVGTVSERRVIRAEEVGDDDDDDDDDGVGSSIPSPEWGDIGGRPRHWCEYDLSPSKNTNRCH